jgi:hypothetical protein
LDRLHIRVHLWWVSRWVRRLLVVTGARCSLTKPVVAAVELQATTELHCSRCVQPGGICVCVRASRDDSRRSRVGVAPRPQLALPMPAAALGLCCAGAASASYASCRSDSMLARSSAFRGDSKTQERACAAYSEALAMLEACRLATFLPRHRA